jgi:hypothetical protein
MTNRKRCICLGRSVNELLAAWYGRARKRIAAGVVNGQPPPDMNELRLTVTLIRALSEGREKGPFQARFRSLDHHLVDCPCSPSYRTPTAAVDTAPSGHLD